MNSLDTHLDAVFLEGCRKLGSNLYLQSRPPEHEPICKQGVESHLLLAKDWHVGDVQGSLNGGVEAVCPE